MIRQYQGSPRVSEAATSLIFFKFNTWFCQLSVSRKEKQPCWHCLKCVFTFHWLVKWLILVVRNKCLPLNVWTTWPLLAFAQSGWGTVTMETVFAHKLSDWVWSVRCSLSVWKDIKHTHWDQRSVTWIVCVLKDGWRCLVLPRRTKLRELLGTCYDLNETSASGQAEWVYMNGNLK